MKLVTHLLLMGVADVDCCWSSTEAASMDARLVWLASSSRADLEASSSISVLQSIYGSQVRDGLNSFALSMIHCSSLPLLFWKI